MVNYRRNKIKGGSYFFTVTLRDRRSKLLTDHVNLLGNAMRKARKENPYQTKAIVILPDHLHAIWQLPEEDADYSTRWRKIKSYFTKEIIKADIKINKNHHGEYDIWQRRFWEHTIRNELDLIRHIDYIHFNPVKHGLVKEVRDWPYSSFHAYMDEGACLEDIGKRGRELVAVVGE